MYKPRRFPSPEKPSDWYWTATFLSAVMAATTVFIPADAAAKPGEQQQRGATEQQVRPAKPLPIPQTGTDEDELIAVSTSINTVRPAKQDFSEELMRQLVLPSGFQIEVFAQGLTEPRIIRVGPNGDVYVTEREAGRVTLLRDTDGDGTADVVRPVATGLGEGLQGVHGLAINENRLYMVTERHLYVSDIQGDGSLSKPQLLTDEIPSGGQHPNRTLEFGPDGMLYLSVGSTCNACKEPDERHAAMLRMKLDGSDVTVYAHGLRNTVGFAWHPDTGEFWGLDHNTDERGDDWPPEELNRIEEGKHYGWPFCGGDREVDFHVPAEPDNGGREEFCNGTEPPVLTYQAHAAPMQMVYYTADQFPGDYRNDAFATMRGSWNRNPPVGYKVVRIRHDGNGRPTSIEPFVSGWLLDDGRAHFGRLTGIAVARDGSLLVSDDSNGVIYRISYERGSPQER
jgi:glucose/arabinose dehydrogenase